MEHRESGVGQLPHFSIGDLGHRSGCIDESWVGGEDGVHIGEIFVQLCIDGRCQYRACNVGTSSGKRDESARLRIPEETWKNGDPGAVTQGSKFPVRGL